MKNRKLSLQFTERDSLQFAARLKELVDSYESASALAREVGVVEGTIRKWANGLSRPKIDEAVNLAYALGVNLLWLATGEGPKLEKSVAYEKPEQSDDKALDPTQRLGVDTEMLQLAIETVEEGLVKTQRMMLPDKKAELILAVYDLFIDDNKDGHDLPKNVVRLIKSVG